MGMRKIGIAMAAAGIGLSGCSVFDAGAPAPNIPPIPAALTTAYDVDVKAFEFEGGRMALALAFSDISRSGDDGVDAGGSLRSQTLSADKVETIAKTIGREGRLHRLAEGHTVAWRVGRPGYSLITQGPAGTGLQLWAKADGPASAPVSIRGQWSQIAGFKTEPKGDDSRDVPVVVEDVFGAALSPGVVALAPLEENGRDLVLLVRVQPLAQEVGKPYDAKEAAKQEAQRQASAGKAVQGGVDWGWADRAWQAVSDWWDRLPESWPKR